MAATGTRLKSSALSLACVLALAACGGSSSDLQQPEPSNPPEDHEEDHDHDHIDTAGRLAVLEPGSAQVHVVELDEGKVLQSHTLDHEASAIYASPGQRYAVLFQRTQNQVQFVDGGIWLEDHGDHVHDYKEAPRLLDARLAGVLPTHYETHDDLAAVFFDGNAGTGDKAAIALLSDASIGSGQAGLALASQELDTPMHGTAEPRGDYLLTTWRAADASGTLPSQVELYHRHGDHYHFEQRFEQQCPGLHGSYSNAGYTVFGCTDGVLVVRQDGDTFTAGKIANPAGLGEGVRIGTITGNGHYDKFVGIASPGHLFEIDPAAGSITRINWAEGRTRRAHALDAEGENLLVLDDTGSLHILDVAGWNKRAEITGAIGNMPQAAPFPAIAVSGAEGKAWLSDPLGQRLHAIDLGDARVEGGIALNFSPGGLVWLGMPEHDHDH